MKCKVEQDLNRHLDQMDKDDEREAMIIESSRNIVEGERFSELFENEIVFEAAVRFIQSLMTENEGTLVDVCGLKDAIMKEAEKMADNFLKNEGR